MANQLGDNTYNVLSKLYRWDGSAFVEAQLIATDGATDWEYFQIGLEHYLAVAHYCNKYTYDVGSPIYRLIFE